MKKLILILILAFTFLTGYSQVDRGEVVTIVDALAPASLSGSDTTIYVMFPVQYSPVWSVVVTWTTITGSGTLALYTCHNTSYWEPYNTSPSVTLTGANNTYMFEDEMFSGRYLGFLITKGSISAGAVTATILLK